jgi:hypothetical protein
LDGQSDDIDGLFVGFDNDTCRMAYLALPKTRLGLDFQAHPSGWHVAMCDGSVQMIGYELDVAIHRRLGKRADGEIISSTERVSYTIWRKCSSAKSLQVSLNNRKKAVSDTQSLEVLCQN